MRPDVVIDGLLDEGNRLRLVMREQDLAIEMLRDALSECLADLPDEAKWYPHQELYVLTDPELRNGVALSHYEELGAA